MKFFYLPLLSLFFAYPALADEVTIPVKHLSDQNLTRNFTKAMVTELSGYITPAGLKPLKSQMTTKLGPGINVTVDGKSYLRVPTSVTATIKGEKSSLESYTLYDQATFNPVKSFQPDGEITVYREVKAHPEFLKVGELALLSKSETFNPGKQQIPIYKTTTLLSLVPVQGDADLFEFCETDYEYRGSSRSKKADSELSSCLLINAKGEVQGYAVLILEPTSRSTYVGNLKIE